MNFSSFVFHVRQQLEPVLLEQGYEPVRPDPRRVPELAYRKVWRGWFLFVDFQYSEESEMLDYRWFYINTLRLTVDSPYGVYIHNEQGQYVEGALFLRIPTGLISFGYTHPFLDELDQDVRLMDLWQYATPVQLARKLRQIRPLLVAQLALLEDPTTTMGY